jgi:hypothetical protein
MMKKVLDMRLSSEKRKKNSIKQQKKPCASLQGVAFFPRHQPLPTMNAQKEIPITGVKPANAEKRIFGYAVCRQWKDNPNNVDVWEYADSESEAKAMIRSLKKDSRFRWFVGVYQ